MAAIDFPGSPAVNDTFTVGGKTWKWDGTTWNMVSGSSMYALLSGTTFTGAVNLAAGTTSLTPFKFVSGPVLTSPSTGAKEYDGNVFYSTPNATTGRAVDVSSYYYISDGTYSVDFSVTSTAKSIFGSAATGLTLIAGTTYEFELMVFSSQTGVGITTPTYSHSFLLTTSGSPTTTIYQQFQQGTNTTSHATAQSMTSLRNINNASIIVLNAAANGVSRYVTYISKGIIRVTGSGSVELSPAISASSTTPDYPFLAAAGSYIKITPIGNGTVTNVGSAWA